jgi:valyl-tRNA synthetase
MLEKTFDPASVEPRLYQAWEASGGFSPKAAGSDDAEAAPFCMVIPPPNVTGSLHVGHALNDTLQDVLARFHRMRGRAVLWLPGTDHAGIATQMVVERQLAAEGNMSRRELGRDAFVERIWGWKAQSGGSIVQQMRRLGCSCDWTRERFTLDEGLSAAVRRVFVQLHKEGLIYRDKRLVNWHPELQTAISDLEVENIETKGWMWRFRYPIEGEEGSFIVVATTRPETMLGDAAVAVHPDDPRYARLIGRQVRLPLADRLIPIIADEHADPEKGTGAVKITPAHDFNDFQVGRRQGLALINIFTSEAKLNDEAPAAYRGLDRFEARRRIVADMDALGLLEGVDPHQLAIPYDEKSKSVVIEPFLTDQWYVDAKTLAGPALGAVRDGRTVFEPRHWDKTYFQWMENIEPWCISRQLWWGHRIPAWYGPDGAVFVEETATAAEEAALAHYGRPTPLIQDEDVLDTWFSSALWPFSTLGWPKPTDDLARFYPTNVVVTSFDIIFFWVARMMMMGLHFAGDVPFERVFINALILDEKGQKMSKTRGNVIDPLDLVDQYGADALRFTLTAMSGPARTIRLSKQRVEGYRNFGTKLWNAARFCQMNGCVLMEGFDPARVSGTLNRWLVGELAKTAAKVTESLEAFAFDEAAASLYRFIWNTLCAWHLELAKPILNGEDASAKAEVRALTAWALDQTLKLLHPVAPFITEELWGSAAEFSGPREGLLMMAAWPELPLSLVDPAAEAEIGWLIEIVSEIRSIRSEMNVPSGARPALALVEAGDVTRRRLQRHRDALVSLAGLETVVLTDRAPAGSASFAAGEATAALALASFINIEAEMARLAKGVAGAAAEEERVAKKLANADFLARAPEAVVAENQEKLAEAQAVKAKLEAALARLESVGF